MDYTETPEAGLFSPTQHRGLQVEMMPLVTQFLALCHREPITTLWKQLQGNGGEIFVALMIRGLLFGLGAVTLVFEFTAYMGTVQLALMTTAVLLWHLHSKLSHRPNTSERVSDETIAIFLWTLVLGLAAYLLTFEDERNVLSFVKQVFAKASGCLLMLTNALSTYRSAELRAAMGKTPTFLFYAVALGTVFSFTMIFRYIILKCIRFFLDVPMYLYGVHAKRWECFISPDGKQGMFHACLLALPL